MHAVTFLASCLWPYARPTTRLVTALWAIGGALGAASGGRRRAAQLLTPYLIRIWWNMVLTRTASNFGLRFKPRSMPTPPGPSAASSSSYGALPKRDRRQRGRARRTPALKGHPPARCRSPWCLRPRCSPLTRSVSGPDLSGECAHRAGSCTDQVFLATVPERRGNDLKAWMAEATHSSIDELARFAGGRQDDLIAVTAGVMLD